MESSLWFPASCTLCDKVKMKQFKNNRIKLYHNTIEYKEKKGCFVQVIVKQCFTK